MKKDLLRLAMAVIVLLGATSCSDEKPKNPPGGDGRISIRIAGTPGVSRIAVTGNENADESKVTAYTVYVFDYTSGILERSVTGNPSYTTTIEGLSTATTKRIYVVANLPGLGTVTNYSQLVNTARDGVAMGAAATVAANGMVMVGESANAVTLSSSQTTQVTVNLKRLLSKVTLGTITLSDASGLVPANFVLQGVSVQRVAHYTNFSGNAFAPAQTQQWDGGNAGPVSTTVNAALADAITLSSPVANTPSSPFNNYFYITDNDGSAYSTVLTLKATYDADGAGGAAPVAYYYPVAINYEASTANGSTTDGTFIQSNHQYRINITIKNPLGMNATDNPDPDSPIMTADLDVTISVDPWELEIVQNTEI